MWSVTTVILLPKATVLWLQSLPATITGTKKSTFHTKPHVSQCHYQGSPHN